MNTKITLAIALFLSISFFGCTNKVDLSGEWKLVRYFVNGIQNSNNQDAILSLKEDGYFVQTTIHPINNRDVKNGYWQINKNLSQLSFFYQTNPKPVNWNIVYLSTDSISITYKIKGFFVERSYVRIQIDIPQKIEK